LATSFSEKGRGRASFGGGVGIFGLWQLRNALRKSSTVEVEGTGTPAVAHDQHNSKGIDRCIYLSFFGDGAISTKLQRLQITKSRTTFGPGLCENLSMWSSHSKGYSQPGLFIQKI